MTKSRYASRRSPDDQQRWNAEKAESEVHRAPERVALRENPLISGAWTCEPCGGIGRCHCDELHTMQVQREQRESIEQAAWLEAQLAMEAV